MSGEIANTPIKSPMDIPDPAPPGNWVAHQLRILNENSEGLLPSTAGSKRSWDKYNTVTHKDYLIPGDVELQDPDFEVEPFQKKRETVADIMLAPHASQSFQNWRVPDKYQGRKDDGSPVEHYEPPLHLKPETILETVAEEVQNLTLSPQPKMVSPLRRSMPPTPAGSPQRLSRQMSLPELKMGNKAKFGMTREYTRLPNMAKASPSPQQAVPQISGPIRSKTDLPMKSPSPMRMTPAATQRTRNIREELETALQPTAIDRAEHWMKLAPQADRKVIERVLKMAEKKNQLGSTLRRSLQPDAKEAVEKWLSTANEQERQVALRFFNSLAGEKLMGKTIDEQKKRLEQVLATLENGQGNGPYNNTSKLRVKPRTSDTRGPGRFQHLRLLSPSTRRNRWMHTTWHHLPEYKTNNIVENWSSHYIRPQAVIPRHFVIHPDWG